MNGILTYFKSFMGFLLIVFLLTACNNDVDLDSSDGSGCITPVEAEALAPSLAQFFGKVDASEFFPYPGYHHDYYNNHDLYYNEYITINSVDDFSNYYKGLLPVPDVDFSKYTLIVGWVYVYDDMLKVENPTIEKKGKYYKLKLPIVCYNVSLCTCGPIYYWSLFPKLSNKKIKVEVLEPVYKYY